MRIYIFACGHVFELQPNCGGTAQFRVKHHALSFKEDHYSIVSLFRPGCFVEMMQALLKVVPLMEELKTDKKETSCSREGWMTAKEV